MHCPNCGHAFSSNEKKQAMSGFFLAGGDIHRVVAGVIRDFINAHGILDKNTSPSLVKRVVGAFRTHYLYNGENQGSVRNVDKCD